MSICDDDNYTRSFTLRGYSEQEWVSIYDRNFGKGPNLICSMVNEIDIVYGMASNIPSLCNIDDIFSVQWST